MFVCSRESSSLRAGILHNSRLLYISGFQTLHTRFYHTPLRFIFPSELCFIMMSFRFPSFTTQSVFLAFCISSYLPGPAGLELCLQECSVTAVTLQPLPYFISLPHQGQTPFCRSESSYTRTPPFLSPWSPICRNGHIYKRRSHSILWVAHAFNSL